MLYKNDKFNLTFAEMRTVIKKAGLPESIKNWSLDDIIMAGMVLDLAQKRKIKSKYRGAK